MANQTDSERQMDNRKPKSEAYFAASDGYAALVNEWRACAKSLLENYPRLRAFMPGAEERARARAEIYAQCANRLEREMRHTTQVRPTGSWAVFAENLHDKLSKRWASSLNDDNMTLVSRLGAHIAQMAAPQRERNAGQLLIEAHAALSETCVWKQNETHGYWEGACGLAWEFTNGTPETNGFWCCPRCGRRVHTANAEPCNDAPRASVAETQSAPMMCNDDSATPVRILKKLKTDAR